jgi:ABC-2 type transport system permease protein
MNLRLFRHILRGQRVRLPLIALALVGWGFLMPTIFRQFGVLYQQLLEQFPMMRQFANFGGTDLSSLAGYVGLGFVHPIAVALVSVFAVGLGSAAIAGERQRGTLEVILARPLTRRAVYLTSLVATFLCIAVCVAALLLGAIAGSAVWGLLDQLPLGNVPVAFLNGVLLFGAYGAIALAASVSFDRLAPALGLVLAVLLLTYFMQILGDLWPDAKGLQPYSLFHYLQPTRLLKGSVEPLAFVVPVVVIVAAVAYALWRFPRRDIAAPS